MEDIEYHCCEVCQSFSHTSPNSWPMFFTVTVDPLLDNFNEKYPDTQFRFINRNLIDIFTKFKTVYNVVAHSLHYEFHANGNLHVHGLIWMLEEYVGYDRHAIILQKMIHNKFGRHGNNSKISGYTYWVDDIERATDYINKSNVYPAKHWHYANDKQINLRDWLMTLYPQPITKRTKVLSII